MLSRVEPLSLHRRLLVKPTGHVPRRKCDRGRAKASGPELRRRPQPRCGEAKRAIDDGHSSSNLSAGRLRSSIRHLPPWRVMHMRPATHGRCDQAGLAKIVSSARHVSSPPRVLRGTSRLATRPPKEEGVAETLIRQRVEDLVKAIRAKDVDAVTSLYARDLVSFDLTPPLRRFGADEKRRAWQGVFAAFSDPLAYETG